MLAFPLATLRTWLRLIRRPGAFFRSPGGAASPLPFAALVYLASLGGALGMHLQALGHGATVIAAGTALGLGLGGLGMLLWVGLGGALLHGGLVAVGARMRPLRETYACLCYASAPLVFLHIPYLGLAIAPAWTLLLGFIGVRAVHGISRRRAVAALAVPVAGLAVLLLCGSTALGHGPGTW